MSKLFGYLLARLSEPSSLLGVLTAANNITQAVQARDYGAILNTAIGVAAILVPEGLAKK